MNTITENTLRQLISVNLKKLIEKTGLTQKDFANRIGLGEVSVSNWINCRRFPEEKAIIAIANFFQVPVSHLFKDESEHQHDIETERSSVIISGQEANFYSADNSTADFAFVVNNDEMSPEYDKGDVVFCKSTDKAENGDLVVVEINGRKSIRRIYFTPMSIVLVCSNTKHSPQQYFVGHATTPTIIGKPIGFQRTLKK